MYYKCENILNKLRVKFKENFKFLVSYSNNMFY